MDDVKYQIFISSTFLDLESVRSKISATILNLQHFPIGMEMFSAGDSEQWEIITETIDVSDYYLLIVGHRYGSVTDEGISFTEKEFDYAVAKGIPVLSFIRERDIPTSAGERENDPDKNARLEAFIAKAKNNKLCEFWNTVDDLATKVAVALPKSFKRMPRSGWTRTQEDNSKQILAELTLLSTENRDLRQKLAHYEALDKKALPNILVEINEGMEITLNSVEHDSSTALEPPQPLKGLSLQKKYAYSALAGSVTEEDIEDYNSKIPSQEVYDRYLQELLFYKSITTASEKLSFNLKNTGSVKASEINVLITFPNFVKICKAIDTARAEAPVSPVPESPVTKERHHPGAARPPLFWDSISNHRSLPSILTPLDFSEVTISQSFSSGKDNQIKIYLNSLLHTLDSSIGVKKLVVIPITKGSGMIEIKIICEQYREEQIIHVPISVQ